MSDKRKKTEDAGVVGIATDVLSDIFDSITDTSSDIFDAIGDILESLTD